MQKVSMTSCSMSFTPSTSQLYSQISHIDVMTTHSLQIQYVLMTSIHFPFFSVLLVHQSAID